MPAYFAHIITKTLWRVKRFDDGLGYVETTVDVRGDKSAAIDAAITANHWV
jgi:hypothetical protein